MLGQILVTGCEVGIILFTQTMPAIKLFPVQVFVSNKISTNGGDMQCSPDAFEELAMRSWLLRLLEIHVIGKGLVVFSKELVMFIRCVILADIPHYVS